MDEVKTYPYFDGPCDLRFDPVASAKLGKEHWRVLNTYTVHFSDVRKAQVLRGTLTDKGTVPICLNGIVPRDGRFEQAYVTHDMLCEYLTVLLNGVPSAISREWADIALEQMLAVLGASPAEGFTIGSAVAAYRVVNPGTKHPSSTPEKRQAEASWADF